MIVVKEQVQMQRIDADDDDHRARPIIIMVVISYQAALVMRRMLR